MDKRKTQQHDYIFKPTKLFRVVDDIQAVCKYTEDFENFVPKDYAPSRSSNNELGNVMSEFQSQGQGIFGSVFGKILGIIYDLTYSVCLLFLTGCFFYCVVQIRGYQNIRRRELSLSYTYSHIDQLPPYGEETSSLNIA